MGLIHETEPRPSEVLSNRPEQTRGVTDGNEIEPSPESKEEMIVIHFLPHSSLEVGGFGTTKETYENYVKGILTKVVTKLIQYKDYRFNWSDVNYLEMFWNDKKVKKELK